MKCGGWTITDEAKNYPECKLPEGVDLAFKKATENVIGAKYTPLMFLGTQVVSGTNYMILCREVLSDKESTVKICTMILNMPVSGEAQILAVNPIV